jgi:TP53 regulating kinase-like protein
MNQQIGQGAEAVIYSDGSTVTKHRIEKGYRLPEIDKSLRQYRTRREAKILEKLSAIDFPAPRLIKMCDKTMKIDMQHIEGDKIRDIFEKDPLTTAGRSAKRLALCTGMVSSNGNLTTSNMILTPAGKVFFVDFGLGEFSTELEIRGVDLHLMKRALQSTHYKYAKECFEAVIEGYVEIVGKKNKIGRYNSILESNVLDDVSQTYGVDRR